MNINYLNIIYYSIKNKIVNIYIYIYIYIFEVCVCVKCKNNKYYTYMYVLYQVEICIYHIVFKKI
jgi:hypothetical protein